MRSIGYAVGALIALAVGGCAGDDGGSDSEIPTATPVAPLRIADVQATRVSVGTAVELLGVVVTGVGSPASKGFWAQDAGGGAFSGIWFLDQDGATTGLVEGDVVDVLGTYEEYYGSSLDSLSEIVVESALVTSNGAAVVSSPVSIVDVSGVDAESWEGCLVEIAGSPSVDDADAGFGEYLVSEGGSSLLVDDAAFASAGYVEDGDVLEHLAGVIHYSFDAFKLEPRAAADAVPAPLVSVPATIAQIQDESAGNHVAQGTIISLDAVLVVATRARASAMDFWLQAPGGGQHSGIYVYDATSRAFPMTAGDVITLAGARYVEVPLPFGSTETQAQLQLKLGSTLAITATGTPTLTGVDFPALRANPEPYEGVLVDVLDDPAEDPMWMSIGFLALGGQPIQSIGGYPFLTGPEFSCSTNCTDPESVANCLCVDSSLYASYLDMPAIPSNDRTLVRVRGIVHYGGPFPVRPEILPRDRCDVISIQVPPSPPCP